MVAVAAFRLKAVPVRAEDILTGCVIIGDLLVTIEIPHLLLLLLHTLRRRVHKQILLLGRRRSLCWWLIFGV